MSRRVEILILIVILGVAGTGIARALMVALIGKVGAPRASVTAYFVPVVALFLGIVALGETVESLQVLGMAVSMTGAYFVSRAD